MPREVRPQFDPGADFYVTRPFKAGGKVYAVDELFDKSLVEARRLRQMYDQRMLRQQGPTSTSDEPYAPVRRRRYRDEAA